MKKAMGMLAAVSILGLAAQSDFLTAYKSGTIKIAPDPSFGAKTEWDTLFKTSTDKWTAFLPEGTFFRPAWSDGKIYKFDAEGNFLKSFGQKGQGPGDLQSPGALDVIGGKTLVVNDAGNRRLSLFDLEGNFLKMVRVGDAGSGPGSIVSLIALADGKIALVTQGSGSSSEGKIGFHYRASIYDLESGTETELLAFDWERPRSKFMVRVIEWEPEVYLAKAGSDRLLVACSGTPEVAFFSFAGKKLTSFKLGVEPTKITWKHLEFVMKADENPKNFGFVAQNKANIELPEYLPLYARLAQDPEGNILVYDYNPARFSRDASFKVYSQDGELLAAVKIDPAEFEPAMLMPVHFWKNFAYVYLTEKDGDGSFAFARFKISEEPRSRPPSGRSRRSPPSG